MYQKIDYKRSTRVQSSSEYTHVHTHIQSGLYIRTRNMTVHIHPYEQYTLIHDVLYIIIKPSRIFIIHISLTLSLYRLPCLVT